MGRRIGKPSKFKSFFQFVAGLVYVILLFVCFGILMELAFGGGCTNARNTFGRSLDWLLR